MDYNKINSNIEILVEAIDFHPYPQMLNILSTSTQIDKNVIKEFIWTVESGYNIRKYFTIESSKLYEKKIEWKKISSCLEIVREELIN
jgi:hypothetical protein